VSPGDVTEAVFLTLEDNAEQQRSDFEAVREWSADVPVLLLISDNVAPPGWLDTQPASGFVKRLRLPAKQPEFNAALEQARAYREGRLGQPRRRNPELFRSLVGESRAIQNIRKLIEQVADTDANVLILGESGTGKEVVARNLHYYSSRREQPFVPVNCGAIPEDLLESELFGHEKGAFTGAIAMRRGRFEMADGGTLFLDEIGDMSLPMQVKLLRVLQERVFERVGSNKSIHSDVRVIAATHRNLEENIAAGRFREDLYYRLNVFPIDMPPLRERTEDLPALVSELIERVAHERKSEIKLTAAAIKALRKYPWPGNVRELANLIERLVILYPNRIVDVRELPEKYQPKVPLPLEAGDAAELCGAPSYPEVMQLPTDGINLKEHLSNLEQSLILQALEEANGVVAHAATLLKMRRTTLVEKLRKYGFKSEKERRDFDEASLANH